MFRPLRFFPLAYAAWTLLWALSIWIDVFLSRLESEGLMLLFHALLWVTGLVFIAQGRRVAGRMLETLRASERKYRLIFDNVSDAILLYPSEDGMPPGRFEEVNRAAMERLGYDRDELRSMTPFDVDASSEETKRHIVELRRVNGARVFETLHRTRDGRLLEVEVNSHRFEFDGRAMALSVARDLTERRESDRRLRESEARHRSLFEKMLDGFALHRIVLDEAGRPVDFVFLEVNESFEKMTGLPRERLVGSRATEVLPGIEAAPFDWIGEYGRVAVEGVELRTEQYLSLFDRWWSVTAYSQEPGCFAAICKDVTARRLAEEKLRRSLDEKDVLLREIHHRVKNNLQIVSSLLSLEAEKSGDPAALDLFRESRDRVRAMALIHERLYRSKNLSGVDFGTFLREACDYLARAYALRDASPRLVVEAADVRLDIDQAIPAGLIVNELVSNALKHAFPRGADRPAPLVTASLTLLPSGELVMAVTDNGVGYSAPVAPGEGKTLGLLLVRTLAQQLKGRLDIGGDGGMRVAVTFRPGARQRRVEEPAVASPA